MSQELSAAGLWRMHPIRVKHSQHSNRSKEAQHVDDAGAVCARSGNCDYTGLQIQHQNPSQSTSLRGHRFCRGYGGCAA